MPKWWDQRPWPHRLRNQWKTVVPELGTTWWCLWMFMVDSPARRKNVCWLFPKIRKHGRLSSPKQIMQNLQQTPIIICHLTPALAWFALLILVSSIHYHFNSKKNGAFPTSSTFLPVVFAALWTKVVGEKAFKQQRTDQAARPAVDDVAGDGWDLGRIPGKGEGDISQSGRGSPKFQSGGPECLT